MHAGARASGAAATLAVVLAAGAARAGVQDAPLPTFSDGKAAQLVAVLPTAIKNNNVETAVICTNLAAGAVDIGFEVFDETGALRNAVSSGDGAILAVGVGRTVTLATGTIAVLTVDGVVTLNGAGSGTNNLRNGTARVVATSPMVGCAALALDHLHTIEDPATCPTCQPPSLTTIRLSGAGSSVTTTTSSTSSTTSTTLAPCPATPAPGCRAPIAGKATLLVRNVTPDSKDVLVWKWTGDVGTMLSDFGDPTTTTAYQLCLYDQPSGASQHELTVAAPAGGTCAGKPCWIAKPTGFTYADKDLTPNGVSHLGLKADGAGGAKIRLKGHGPNLGLPTLPLSPPVAVQLRASNGQCWGATYSTPKSNGATLFKAKSD